MVLVRDLLTDIFVKFRILHDLLDRNSLIAKSGYEIILVTPCSNIVGVCKAQIQSVYQIRIFVNDFKDVFCGIGLRA